MKSLSVFRIGVPFALGSALLMSAGCDMRRISAEATAAAEEMLENCSDQDIDDVWENTSEGFRDETNEEALAGSCHSFLLRLGEFEGVTEVRSVNRQKNSDEDRMTLGLLTQYEVGEVEITLAFVREDDAWMLHAFDFDIEDVEPMERDMDELRELADEQVERLKNGEYEDFVMNGMSFRTAMTTEQLTTGMENMLRAHGGLSEVTFREFAPTNVENSWSVLYDMQFGSGPGRMRIGYEWAGAGWEFLNFDAQPGAAAPTPNGAPNGAGPNGTPNGAGPNGAGPNGAGPTGGSNGKP